MKNRKNLIIAIAALVVVVAAAIVIVTVRNNRIAAQQAAAGNVGDTAISRSQEDEGDIHYFDDGAIALAGEAPQSSDAIAQAEATLDLVNEQRASAGLPALVWNENLVAAAMVRAAECERSFSHTRPDGNAWYTVNSQIMYGENLAYLFSNAASVVKAWMDSPTHRENILGNYSSVGVATYQTQSGDWYWAQEFGY